jgi:hypothetical protein
VSRLGKLSKLLSGKGLLLLCNENIFYEFIPLEEIGKENPQRFMLEEVELDKNYTVKDISKGSQQTYTGKQLHDGLSIELQAGGEQLLLIKPTNAGQDSGSNG